MFSLKPQRKNTLSVKVAKTLTDRMEFVCAAQAADVADETLEQVKFRIPKSADFKQYSDALGVYEVVGVSGDEWFVVGVIGKAKRLSLKAIDRLRTVLYIRPSETTGEMSAAAELLRRWEPWTHATLPYQPSLDEADVVARRVSEREVGLVESRLARMVPSIRAELQRMGVDLAKQESAVRRIRWDLLHFALRLEYGLEGFPKVSHWKPALRQATEFLSPRARRAMVEPYWIGWKSGVQRLRKVTPAAGLENVFEFQEQLI